MARSSTGRWTSKSVCSVATRRYSQAGRERGGPQSARAQDAQEAGMRRVVVTGMGIVSSIGNNTQEVLASLHEAKSGISRAEDFASHGFRCQVQGMPTLDPSGSVDRRAMRFLAQGSAWNHVAME